MQQALLNLVINALDAMPSGGTLELGLRPLARGKEEGAELTVRDDGIGMPPDVQNRMFEPFFTTKGEKGTGLGMAMVGTIVRRHGGTISTESAPGSGTEVRIWLPSSDSAHNNASLPHKELLEGVRVLVVDDEPGTRNTVSRVLQRFGLVVEPVGSGKEVLGQQTKFDVVVCDVMLPDMLGTDLIDAAPLSSVSSELPFVFMSGFSGVYRHVGAKENVAFVKKPFESKALLKAIESVLRR